VQHYISIGEDALAFDYAERGRARTFIYHANREQIDFGENASSQTLEEWRSTGALLADFYDQQNQLLGQQQSDDTNTETSASVDQELRDVNAEIERLERDMDRLQASIEAQQTVLSQVVYVDIPSIEDIRPNIDPDTTLISYYVVQERSDSHIYAFVITSEGFSAVSLGDIEDLGFAVFNAVDARTNVENAGMDRLADTLFGGLIGSSDSFVQEAMTNQNWIVAPHSALNVLPFTALLQSSRPDTDVYLQYTPSASFYVALRHRLANVNPITSASTALVFGNPRNSETPQGLADLRFAEDEAATIAGLFRTTERIEDDADESVFVAEASRADVIHIAAHGVIEVNNPLSTYLLLSDDEESGRDGRLEVREIYTLQLQNRSPLVVLSACETNIDNLVDGDEFQGLARAFLVSGARGVVASLWRVDDEATSVLMEHFHQYVAEGDHPSVALQKAQTDVRTNTDNNWAAPNFWAGFVYVGV
jgi:hypothetical protein